MHNKQPYSFEKTDVRGRFLLNFSCTKVQSNDVSPIAGNVLRLCVCLPLAQGFKFTTKVNGANSTKPLLCVVAV